MADPDNPQTQPEECPGEPGYEQEHGRKGGARLARGRRGRPFGENSWAGFGWVNAACWLLLLVVLGALWLPFGH